MTCVCKSMEELATDVDSLAKTLADAQKQCPSKSFQAMAECITAAAAASKTAKEANESLVASLRPFLEAVTKSPVKMSNEFQLPLTPATRKEISSLDPERKRPKLRELESGGIGVGFRVLDAARNQKARQFLLQVLFPSPRCVRLTQSLSRLSSSRPW